jgi:quinol monooxygenase YgiN
MIHVVAIVTAKPGQRELLLAAFREVIPLVLGEAGCIEYSATIDALDSSPAFGPDVFVVLEKWESRKLLDAHSTSQHMNQYAKDTAHLVNEVAVHLLSEI